MRALDQLDPTPLSGLGNPQGLFVSPDGQWIGFSTGTTAILDSSILKKVAITGGPPVTLAKLVQGEFIRGATWGEDGTIVYATNLSMRRLAP